MTEEIPSFGTREAGVAYRTRPSVYAVGFDQLGRVAVVKEPRGYSLPGGGIESGEDAGAALARECAEECGLSVRILGHIGDAVQFLHAPGEGHFRIIGSFFHCAFAEGPTLSTEPDHELLWLPQDEAARLMRRPFEVWAIRAYQRKFG